MADQTLSATFYNPGSGVDVCMIPCLQADVPYDQGSYHQPEIFHVLNSNHASADTYRWTAHDYHLFEVIKSSDTSPRSVGDSLNFPPERMIICIFNFLALSGGNWGNRGPFFKQLMAIA